MGNILNTGLRIDKREFWLGVGIFTLALVVRLIYLYEVSKSPTFLVPIIDSATYDRVARELATGHKMSDIFFWQSFFYPFFLSRVYFFSLSGVYFFSGGLIICVKLIQALLGSILCVLVYRLGQQLFDRRTGVLAGVVMALNGALIFFESQLLATGWASFWSVVLLLLFLKAGEKAKVGGEKRHWMYFVIGVCGGLSIITRATFLPFFTAACVWLALTLHRASVRWRMIAVRARFGLVGFLLVVGSVAIMCFYTTGRFSFLPGSGPINLYIGNNPETAKTITARPGFQWRNLSNLPVRHGAKDVHEARRFFVRRFRNYVAAKPLNYLKGLAYKTVQFCSSREIPRNFDMYIWRKYSLLFSAITWKIHGFGFPFGLLLPLAILGLIRYWHRIPLPVILFLILYPLGIILVFVSGRTRMPVIPVMAVLAAAGFWNFFEAIKTKRWLHTAAMVAVIMAIALLSSIAGPFPAETFNYESEMHHCVGFVHRIRGRVEQSIFHLSEALRLNPCYFDARKNLGYVLYEQGKPQEAIEHFKKALEINPESGYVHYYLAITVLDLGKTDQAAKHLQEALCYARASANPLLVAKIKNRLREVKPALVELDDLIPPSNKN
jgi:4-amino-4-deoxy-L-arabinose transferase-like glycosyltransferase